jgi:hypothetical protein
MTFVAVEALVCSPARQAMGVRTTFGNDLPGYFTERLDVEGSRLTTVGVDLNPRKM